jgi:hypothetical protein
VTSSIHAQQPDVLKTSQTSNNNKLRRSRLQWLSGFAGELAALVVVVALVLVPLGRMAGSLWSAILLYNGDSLVLPLLYESIASNEPFEWVFSSQLFFFPEAILYSAIAFFFEDPRATIITNSVVNVLLFYAFTRLIARFALRQQRHRLIEIMSSLVAVGLLVAFCLLEPEPNVNGSAIATLFLFNTYYQGVIIVGAGVLVLTLWALRATAGRRRRTKALVAATTLSAVVTAAITLCDPLYLLQVTVPLVAAFTILWFTRHVTWRTFALLCGTNIAAALLGLWARKFFESFLSISLDKYLDIEKIPSSLTLLGNTLDELMATSLGLLKLALWIGLIALALLFFAYALFAQSRPRLRRTVSTVELFIGSFSALSAVTMTLAFIATGSQTTRYLLPLFLFPLLSATIVVLHIWRRIAPLLRRESTRHRVNLSLRFVSAAGAAGILVAGGVSAPAVYAMSTGADYVGVDCFNNAVADTSTSGVGSFWVTRQWDLYGAERGDVLQVKHDLTVEDWMINLASYENERFSYVIVDPWNGVGVDSIAPLGEPADATQCGDFTIYDFAGTPGEQLLTDTIAESTEQTLEDHGFRS